MPKKLIRYKITQFLKEHEWEMIKDKSELNKLYALKVQEELAEIQRSEHNDITEFADLLEVVRAFALSNGFTFKQVSEVMTNKTLEKGGFGNIALNNMNPNNKSNKIYFNSETPIGNVYEELAKQCRLKETRVPGSYVTNTGTYYTLTKFGFKRMDWKIPSCDHHESLERLTPEMDQCQQCGVVMLHVEKA
jgi:predicted house-cleaning noncanonical NTP pyrophosphatase (MazG superfamily)